jgi:hypothetical protein
MKPYHDSWEHLADALETVLFLLRSQCLYKMRSAGKVPQLPGLHISHEEAAAILEHPLNPFPLDKPLVPVSGPFDPDELAAAWVSRSLIPAWPLFAIWTMRRWHLQEWLRQNCCRSCKEGWPVGGRLCMYRGGMAAAASCYPSK